MTSPQRSTAPPPAPPGARYPDARTRGALGLFGVLLIAAFISSTLPLPFGFAAIVFAAWAVAVGVRAMISLRRETQRGMAIPVIVVGLVASGLLVASVGTLGLVYPIQVEWQTCRTEALTLAATQACDDARTAAIDDWLSSLARRGSR